MTLSVVGSVAIAGLDMLGVAAMLPLMLLVTGANRSQGLLGFVSRFIGTTAPEQMVLFVATVVAIAFVLKSVATIGFRWWLLGRTTRLEAQAIAELLRRYVQAPYWAHRRRNMAEVHRALGSVSQVFGQVVQGALSFVGDVLILTAIGVVLLVVSPLATAVAIVFFVAVGLILQTTLRPRYRRLGESLAEAELQSWASLMPALNGFRESRLADASHIFLTRFADAKSVRAHASREMSLVFELPKYVLEVAFVAGIGGVAALLFATSAPEQAIAVIGVFAAGSTRILPTINRLVATSGSIRGGQIGLSILADELRSLDDEGEFVSNTSGLVFTGNIYVDNVRFKFVDSEDWVLDGVTTTIAEGSTTAYVGASGAGKSTLLDLVLGLLEPTSGEIRCGDRLIAEDLSSWYSGLGVVPQDVFILDDTLERNIAFGVGPGHIDQVALARAIGLAQLKSLIDELPDGLQTRLGERGVRLSGGQRQRVGIARALYRSPRILVLDEATSALDNVTEHRITETIAALRGTMTIIVVAHRLSTVRHADKVVFMAGGMVEAEGTFEEVEARSTGFAELVTLGKL